MPAAITVTAHVSVPESAIVVTAMRASGPGGQNVNKVSSKVDVRIDLEAITGLDAASRARLLVLAATSLDGEGKLQVQSQKTRDQARNIEDAYDKVRTLITKAMVAPRPRRPTKPTRGSVKRRLEDKKQTASRKAGRSRARDD